MAERCRIFTHFIDVIGSSTSHNIMAASPCLESCKAIVPFSPPDKTNESYNCTQFTCVSWSNTVNKGSLANPVGVHDLIVLFMENGKKDREHKNNKATHESMVKKNKTQQKHRFDNRSAYHNLTVESHEPLAKCVLFCAKHATASSCATNCCCIRPHSTE